jgi:hypothetical protein
MGLSRICVGLAGPKHAANIFKVFYIHVTVHRDKLPYNTGVKGSRPGRTGVTVLPRGDTVGPLWCSSYSPGVVGAEDSLSSPKTVCAW